MTIKEKNSQKYYENPHICKQCGKIVVHKYVEDKHLYINTDSRLYVLSNSIFTENKIRALDRKEKERLRKLGTLTERDFTLEDIDGDEDKE